MESCGLKCLKWLMFAFNFLFFIFGCVLLGLGIWVVVDGGSFMSLFGVSNSNLFNVAYLFIVVGVALIIISFFGFCGAVKENQCMLGMFFFFVFVIFILEIVAAILAFIYYPQIEAEIIRSMSDFDNSTTAETRLITDTWNLLQIGVQCCGYNNTSNWELYGPFPKLVNGTQNALVPLSCCIDRSGNLDPCLLLKDNFHTKGCETTLQSYFWVIGGVGIAVLVIELLAMIFACCLYKAGEKDDNYV